MKIRVATDADHEAIWNIFHEIVAAGDTYALDPEMSREEALAYWFRADARTYVVEENGRVLGTYILKPNQSGHGSHVANAAFMVASYAQGSGSKLLALCQARFVIPKKDLSMFTSCTVRCSKISRARRARRSRPT